MGVEYSAIYTDFQKVADQLRVIASQKDKKENEINSKQSRIQ